MSKHLALRMDSQMAETGAREGPPAMDPKKLPRTMESRGSVGVSGIAV